MPKQQMVRFKRSDIPGIVLVIVVLTFWLYVWFERPDWQSASGFGPEWQCNGPGARSAGRTFASKNRRSIPPAKRPHQIK